MGRNSYAKCLTAVSPLTVALVSAKPTPDEIVSSSRDKDLDCPTKLKIDEWIEFETNVMTAKVVSFLRDQLHRLFNRKIHSLSKAGHQMRDKETDDSIIESIVKVLDREEQNSGFIASESWC